MKAFVNLLKFCKYRRFLSFCQSKSHLSCKSCLLPNCQDFEENWEMRHVYEIKHVFLSIKIE